MPTVVANLIAQKHSRIRARTFPVRASSRPTPNHWRTTLEIRPTLSGRSSPASSVARSRRRCFVDELDSCCNRSARRKTRPGGEQRVFSWLISGRPDRDVIVHGSHTLDPLGKLTRLVFLRLRVHEAAQLTGTAIYIHVHLVELIVRIGAQSAMNVVSSVLSSIYWPVLRVFEFPAQPVSVPTAPVVNKPRDKTMLMIFVVFFIISFSSLLFTVFVLQKLRRTPARPSAEVLRFNRGQIPARPRKCRSVGRDEIQRPGPLLRRSDQYPEIDNRRAQDVRRQSCVTYGKPKNQIPGSGVHKAMFERNRTKIAADAKALGEEKVHACTAAKFQIMPGEGAVVKVMRMQITHAEQVDRQLAIVIQMLPIQSCQWCNGPAPGGAVCACSGAL